MGWLRKERDLIGLVVVWAILLQAIILPFTSGLHAGTRTSGPQSNILCTSRGTVVIPDQPGQGHKKPDCQCCHMSCRQGSACGGILPGLARVPLPSSTVITIAGPRLGAPASTTAKHTSAQPRAPPLA